MAEQRKEIFRTNLKRIEMHNYLHSVGLKSYTLGVNEYADMVSVLYVLILPLTLIIDACRPANHYQMSRFESDLGTSITFPTKIASRDITSINMCVTISCRSPVLWDAIYFRPLKKFSRLADLRTVLVCAGQSRFFPRYVPPNKIFRLAGLCMTIEKLANS